ncbi:AAA family ATPase [Kitasatospora sp. NPDC094011]|uniref:helix-turn-helix transcriptional regulator n=1 Tax=Kitasatospora sp. NPDC094011 TaxID=3364090 RepID=UPI00381EC333
MPQGIFISANGPRAEPRGAGRRTGVAYVSRWRTPDDTQLLARESEMAGIRAAVDGLRSGRGAVIEIAGDPGMGKSALLRVIADHARARGIPVSQARAVRRPTVPYQVFVDAYGDRLARETVDEQRNRCRSFWASTTGTGPTPEDHFRRGRVARELLADWAAAQGGAVLVLDDLHLCDPESAELAAQLIRTPVPGPLLLAVAHRPRQTPLPLLEELSHGVRAGAVVRIEPAALDPAAVTALLGHRDPAPADGPPGTADLRPTPAPDTAAPPDDSEQLCAAADGNPAYVRILAAADWHPADWPESPGENRDGLLREAVALAAELNALTPEATVAIDAAAVLGAAFDPADLAAVSGLDHARIHAALAELTHVDLLRPVSGGMRFTFRHPVLRHVAHERANAVSRQSAHRRALDLLKDRDSTAAARARHAEQLIGTDRVTALETLVEGAQEVADDAPATAARWLRLALESLTGGEVLGLSRDALLLARARALAATGQLADARALSQEVLRNAAQLDPELRAEAYLVSAACERQLGRYREAEALVRAALGDQSRPPAGPAAARIAELALEYSQASLFEGTYEQSHVLVGRTAQATRGADDQASACAAKALAALGDTYLGAVAAAAPVVTDCARQLDGLPDAVVARNPELPVAIGWSELFLERFPAASRHFERGLAVTKADGQQQVLTHLLLGQCNHDTWTGRLDRAVRSAWEAERLARAADAHDVAGRAMALRALALAWAQGTEQSAAVVALAEAGAHSTRPGDGWWAGSKVGALAQTQLITGNAPGALRTLLEDGGGDGLPLLQPTLLPQWLGTLTIAAVRCGDRTGAERWARQADEAAERLGLPGQRMHALRARALVHASGHQHDAAVVLFEQSAQGFRRAGLPIQQIWTLVLGAASTASVHGPAAAAAQLESAVQLAGHYGALRLSEEALREQGKLTAGTPRAPLPLSGRQQALSLLTERELEVARLVGAGGTSRQVAHQLVLSTRTVETHLQRIYRKLDVPSRAALARLVERELHSPG